ncbi:hypothetical protein MNB_SV-6-272 [hydrothermal vent metagenome]|uniref:Uncharacterized protein n=1 Tax=hydrothermal vent metagenome TaxID=652676 RepID=A0A1W1BT57_9ZZZZ
MKIYYYAYSGHKYGLDRVKRGVALIKSFEREGIKVELLLNDFRAGLVAKDLGVKESTTIETFLDIDAVAQRGDMVFIDTPEDVTTKLQRYYEKFTPLFRIVDDCESRSLYGEKVIKPIDNDNISSIMVDTIYYKELQKEDRVLLFLGDADQSRDILSNIDFFEERDMELLLGSYFYIKYEEQISRYFSKVHEADEYSELIRSSSKIVTSSKQTAFEAIASKVDVVYMKQESDSQCLLEELEEQGVKIINYFDKKELLNTLEREIYAKKMVKSVDITVKNIIIAHDL